jgi:hypothetical protein
LQAYRRGCCGTPVGRRRPHAPTCANEAQRLRVLAARAAYDKRVAAAACCDAPAKHGAAPCPMWEPDWTKGCGTCDAKPVLPHTGLCGPCTFGEAATAGGNW